MNPSYFCALAVTMISVVASLPVMAQEAVELKKKTVELTGFAYEDAESKNRQVLEFEGECKVILRIYVDWFDGGVWLTTQEIPLQKLLVDQIRIAMADDTQPYGLYLETSDESIVITEERDGRSQTSRTYSTFIRLQNSDDAVQVFLALKRLAKDCGVRSLK